MCGNLRAWSAEQEPRECCFGQTVDSETTGFVSLWDHNGPAGETGAAIGDVIAEFLGFDTATEAPTRTEGMNGD